MTTYGVWTDNDGGFVTDRCYLESEAAEIRDDMIYASRMQGGPDDAADTAADLTVIRMCDDHDEQPHFGCEDCAVDDGSADDDDTEED